MQTKIEPLDGKIHVTGPYSETNNDRWRNLGGKFSGGSWVLPDNPTARQALAELFGPKSSLVDVLVPYDRITLDGKIAQIGGYVLASRRGRDARVEMPEGVSLAAGKFRSSGGSVKNPSVSLDSDTVFLLTCRASFADAAGLKGEETPAAMIEV